MGSTKVFKDFTMSLNSAISLICFSLFGGAMSLQAICEFGGIGSGDVIGAVMLFQVPGDNLVMSGTLLGLNPGQKHGFHIHAEGSLDDECSGAGGHFNPFGKKHGAPTDEERHVGDLGNIVADGAGVAEFTIQDTLASLEGEDDLGRGGDEGSETTGNAGARLGCCIIGEL